MKLIMSPTMSTSPDLHLLQNTTTSFTAPSSPRQFHNPFDYNFHYSSTPTSPTRASAIYSHFSSFNNDNDDDNNSTDFAFDSARFSTSLALTEFSSADELFDNGKIRPLQPAPIPVADRGRQKTYSVSSTAGNRGSRSLSPLRDHKNSTASTTVPMLQKRGEGGNGSRKWRLKDLLLFRSASEGRATGRESRDPLRKYALFPSFFSTSGSKRSVRSVDSCGGSVRRGGGVVASAHEIHYTANRAAAEEQRKKTAMAYQRPGLFGFIQYNPAIRSITRGFNGYPASSKT